MTSQESKKAAPVFSKTLFVIGLILLILSLVLFFLLLLSGSELIIYVGGFLLLGWFLGSAMCLSYAKSLQNKFFYRLFITLTILPVLIGAFIWIVDSIWILF